METVENTAGEVKSARYTEVNGTWPPALPKLTGPEAVTAAKRLYRKFMGKTFTGPVKVTCGNRRSYVRWGVLRVNPEAGWHNLVHDLSHHFHNRRYRKFGENYHDGRHEFIEREMVKHVVASGWLTGTLRRPEKVKPAVPAQELRHKRIVARLASWERKAKRAETAIKKLRRQLRYYESRKVA